MKVLRFSLRDENVVKKPKSTFCSWGSALKLFIEKRLRIEAAFVGCIFEIRTRQGLNYNVVYKQGFVTRAKD